MRPSWLRYLLLVLLSHNSPRATALPAVAPTSPNASTTPQLSQTLSSLTNITNANTTALTLWPPLPYTIPLYAGGIGTLTFDSDRNTPGTPAQLATAQRIASWLSHFLTTRSNNLAINFSGVYVPSAEGADADGVRVIFIYAPVSASTSQGMSTKTDTDLGNVVHEFFDAEARFGCRALGALFAITEPASVRGLGILELLFGWDDDVTRLLPAGAGSAAGKPVIFLIDSPAMPDGVMEVVAVGARFSSAVVRKRAYYLMTVMIDLLEAEFPHELIANFGRYDSESGLKVSYESERLVAAPRLDGEEIAATLRTYRDLVVKRLGGCSIRFNMWKGSAVYGRLIITQGMEAGNGTVLDETLINGTSNETNPILQLGNGTASGEAQLTRT